MKMLTSGKLEHGSHNGVGGTVWVTWRGCVPPTWRRKLLLTVIVRVARLLGMKVWVGEFR